MKQRPVLFNGAMVRTLLDGSKTQTRRIVKPHGWTIEQISKYEFVHVLNATEAGDLTCKQPAIEAYAGFKLSPNATSYAYFKCPLGTVDDQLWVRENWQYYDWTEDGMPCIRFAADNQTMWAEDVDESAVEQWEILSRCENYNIDNRARDRKWRPSIHMHRWASRITLEIISIRVERLQDISEEDALAEGATPLDCDHARLSCEEIGCYGDTAKAAFRGIWESTGGDWHANPWVWVIGFKRVQK